MNGDGPVHLDSDFAKKIGFTSDKFDGYGWILGKSFYVSFIVSKDEGKGNFRAMVDRLIQAGLTVKVPTPFARMKDICTRYGFTEKVEQTDMGPCEILEKTP